jgi:hypothetical protein
MFSIALATRRPALHEVPGRYALTRGHACSDKRPPSLLRGRRRDQPVQIPFVPALGRFFHYEQVNRLDLSPALTNLPGACMTAAPC